MTPPTEPIEYGIAGGLLYLVLKLVLDFLSDYRKDKVDCIKSEEFDNWRKNCEANRSRQDDKWNDFLDKFILHHREDQQLLKITESLEMAIKTQTATCISIDSSLRATHEALRQLATHLAAERAYRNKNAPDLD